MYLQSEVFFGLLTLLQLLQTIDKVCVKNISVEVLVPLQVKLYALKLMEVRGFY